MQRAIAEVGDRIGRYAKTDDFTAGEFDLPFAIRDVHAPFARVPLDCEILQLRAARP